MAETPELTDMEAAVLETVHAEGSIDLYALARTIGTGPRTVQEAVQTLSQNDLVIVSDRGFEMHCTPAGEDLVRGHR